MGSGKSSGSGQTHDYYGSIAGETNCERLDFIWGVLKDDKIVWPECREWTAKSWKANSYVLYGDLVYHTSAQTSAVPPAEPWTLIPNPTFAQLHSKPWSTNGWSAGSCVVFNGRIYETTADTNIAPPAAPWILFRRDRANTPNPFKFTIPDLCEAFLYWGTGDQVLDTVDEQFLSAYGHPPYRWRTVLALKKCLFGTEIQTAPNITVLGGRAPQQSLIVGAAAELDADWQANPWCVIAELLTHPVIGYGWPAARLHQASWQEQADWCYARSALTYISPYYDSQASLRSIIPELLSYVDGFLFWNSEGQLQAGRWPHGEAPPAFNAANTLDMHDLVNEIQWDTDSFNGTSSATVVNFQDIAGGFATAPAQAPNLLNRLITRRAKSRTVDRPFVVRASQATALATEEAKLNGEPFFKGTLTVRAEKAAGVIPGKLFELTDDLLQVTRVARCTGKTISAPPAGTVKISFESERGLSEQPYQATQPDFGNESKPAPALITDFQLVQIPDALAEDGGSFRLVCLAARNNALTTSFAVWWKQAEAADSFEQLANSRSFAVAGTINASANSADVVNEILTTNSTLAMSYPLANSDVWNLTLQWGSGSTWTNAVEGADYVLDATTGTVLVSANSAIPNGSSIRATYSYYLHVTLSAATPLSDFEAISSPLTADEVNNNTLLLFAFNATDPHSFEVMSVKAVEAANNGEYRIRVRRKRYGTKTGGDGAHVWNVADRVFIAFRSHLTTLAHESFEALALSETTATFRLVPASAWVQAGVEDVFDDANNPGGLTTELQYAFTNRFAPVVEWVSLQRNGAEISDFTATFALEDKFLFSFKLTDANGDLSQATLTARLGSVEQTLWSQTLSGFEVVKSAQFSLPSTGAWQVFCIVSDASGNVTEYSLTAVGGQDAVYLNIQNTTTTTVAPSPIILSYNVSGNYITDLIFGWMESGLTILYQVQSGGAVIGAWSTAANIGSNSRGMYRYGTVPNFPKTYTLYAKTQKAGYTDSPVVHWTF